MSTTLWREWPAFGTRKPDRELRAESNSTCSRMITVDGCGAVSSFGTVPARSMCEIVRTRASPRNGSAPRNTAKQPFSSWKRPASFPDRNLRSRSGLCWDSIEPVPLLKKQSTMPSIRCCPKVELERGAPVLLCGHRRAWLCSWSRGGEQSQHSRCAQPSALGAPGPDRLRPQQSSFPPRLCQ